MPKLEEKIPSCSEARQIALNQVQAASTAQIQDLRLIRKNYLEKKRPTASATREDLVSDVESQIREILPIITHVDKCVLGAASQNSEKIADIQVKNIGSYQVWIDVLNFAAQPRQNTQTAIPGF